MKRWVRIWQLPRSEPLEQYAIQVFGAVIAELVGAVDAALHAGQVGVSRTRSARFIFNVPEIEIGAMLQGNATEPVILFKWDVIRAIEVPVLGELVVKCRDFVDREH